MADLDTRSKRASSVNVLKPYAADLILPDGTIDQGDRQHSAWAYSGILAAAPGGGGLPFFMQYDLLHGGMQEMTGGMQ